MFSGWPTWREVDLDEAIAYHEQLPREKDYHQVLTKVKEEGRILVQVSIGHALVEEMIRDG